MYNSNQKKIIAEALRQTELQLEDFQRIASEAESKAFQFSGVCLVVATLAVGFAEKAQSSIVAYLTALGLLISAILVIYSAMPRKFHVRGHYWKDWVGHVDDNDEFEAVLVSQAKENDDRLSFNFNNLESSARYRARGFWIAFVSISLFLIVEAALALLS